MGSQNGWDVSNSSIFTNATVTAGATRGSSTVTVSTTAGLGIGRLIWFSALASSTVTVAGSWADWFGTRPFTQTVKVTGISGNSVSFTPAINSDYLSGTILAH